MPLLTRMIGAPLFVDIGPGAVAQLAPLLADRRISSGGHVAVVVGPGLGEEIAEMLRPELANADIWTRRRRRRRRAPTRSPKRLRAGFYDALVGIGGGRTLDVAKLAVDAQRAADGRGRDEPRPRRHRLAGRVAGGGRPQGLLRRADADRAGRRPRLRAPLASPAMRRSGIGDAISNLSAIADWRLAGRERGEPVDGLAVTFAQTAAKAILHRSDGIDDEDFLVALAEALVLSGLAMATAGSSRPCSGADHEILHAIDHLYPGTARHGELAGAATLFTSLPARRRGDGARRSTRCLTRHGLPRTAGRPGAERGAVRRRRCCTRRGRGPTASRCSSTSALDEQGVSERVRGFLDAFDR